MAMPQAPASEPAMPTPNVTTVKDGPLPVLPSLLGQPFDLVGGVPLVAGLPVLTSPCSNCYVTGIQVDMVFADKTTERAQVLHVTVLGESAQELRSKVRGRIVEQELFKYHRNLSR